MTPSDTDGLVERLNDEQLRLSGRSIERGCADSGIAANLAMDAVTTIEAQAARIAELEGALEPFAAMADEIERVAAEHDPVEPATIIRKVSYARCVAARKALGRVG